MPNSLESDLQYLATRPKLHIELLQNGARLEKQYAKTIQSLTEETCRGRFSFARATLRRAKIMLSIKPACNRAAVSSAYYAMYHAARTVVYYHTGGDDNESHADLPKHLPRDFPDQKDWENTLKAARLNRNQADYEPYPAKERTFATMAASSISNADRFLKLAAQYLRRKGCAI